MLSISEIKTTLSENSIQGVMGLFFKAFFNDTPSFRLGQNVVKTRSGENAEVTGIGPFFPIIFENDGLMCEVKYPCLVPFHSRPRMRATFQKIIRNSASNGYQSVISTLTDQTSL